MVKQRKSVRFWDSHKQTILFGVSYALVFLLASYIFYLRFPNNFQSPNFYAEDGWVLAHNIIDHGFINAMLTTFNGYYIWGLYFLAKTGFVINHLFLNNEFANLPRSFSLVSYFFLGFLATLPMLLFRKYFRPIALALIITLSIAVPMLGSDYAIIGTLGNLKFAFIYLAFLLLVYRHLMPEHSKKVYLVDIGLLICAYTNITVYAMMLFAFARYIPKLKNRYFYKELIRDRTFQSLFILALALMPQLYVVARDGVPQLKGYLDTPFQFKRTVEIFIERSYLYTFLFPLNKLLSDIIVLVLALITFTSGIIFAGKYRKIFIFGLLTVFISTFLFVIKRTGISDSYLGYLSGGPDQFFYPQNWIFSFIITLVVVQLISRFKRFRYQIAAYIVIFSFIILGLFPLSSTFGKNDFMSKDVGTIYEIGKRDCDSSQQQFNIPLYPSPNVIFYSHVSRIQLCTASVQNYYPHTVELGLVPYNNHYLAGLGTKNTFTQTFQSPQNKLSGVSVYFSTFLVTVHSPYTFNLLDATCQKSLRKITIPAGEIKDNDYFTVNFSPFSNSKNKSYCFSITSSQKDQADPLAVQLSKPDIYPAGIAKVNNKVVAEDIVFSLYYK